MEVQRLLISFITITTGRNKYEKHSYSSVDPLCEKYYSTSPYVYCGNNFIKLIDPNGTFQLDPQTAKDYPALVEYYKNCKEDFQNKPQEFKDAFYETSGLNEKQTMDMLTYGSGPTIQVVENLKTDKGIKADGLTEGIDQKNGTYSNANNGKGLIKIDKGIADMVQNADTKKTKDASSLMIEVVTFHEGTHFGNYKVNHNGNGTYGESGAAFETKAYGEVLHKSTVGLYLYYKYGVEKIPPHPIYLQNTSTPANPSAIIYQRNF